MSSLRDESGFAGARHLQTGGPPAVRPTLGNRVMRADRHGQSDTGKTTRAKRSGQNDTGNEKRAKGNVRGRKERHGRRDRAKRYGQSDTGKAAGHLQRVGHQQAGRRHRAVGLCGQIDRGKATRAMRYGRRDMGKEIRNRATREGKRRGTGDELRTKRYGRIDAGR